MELYSRRSGNDVGAPACGVVAGRGAQGEGEIGVRLQEGGFRCREFLHGGMAREATGRTLRRGELFEGVAVTAGAGDDAKAVGFGTTVFKSFCLARRRWMWSPDDALRTSFGRHAAAVEQRAKTAAADGGCDGVRQMASRRRGLGWWLGCEGVGWRLR